MADLTKREWLGAFLILARVASGILFLTSLVFIFLWFRSSYTGPIDVSSVLEWVRNPENFKEMEPVVAMITLVLSLPLGLSSFLGNRLRDRVQDDKPQSKEESRELKEWQTVRTKLINTVHSHWIDGYLCGSLVRRVQIRLGAEKATDAISNPINFEIEEARKPSKLTENGLLRIFDESGGCLLILGEPGSGKTFILVQLTEQLLKRAKSDPDVPVPVIVPLTSWAMDQQPIDVWLTSELQHHYGLSKKTTPTVLKLEKGLTILLDGLDEVREGVRSACLNKIQSFAEDFLGNVGVCSRTNEYFALDSRLSRGHSIRLLPLTETQIDKYINDIQAGTMLNGLRKSLDKDANFQKLASTPLMLNLMALVYSSDPDTLKSHAATTELGESIFRRYVQQMFLRKKIDKDTGKANGDTEIIANGHAVHWLQQIAKQMREHDTTAFYIEHIQPTWVTNRWIATTIFGLIFGLSVGLFVGLIGVLIFGLVFGLVFGLIGGLIVGFSSGRTGGASRIDIFETVKLRFNLKKLTAGLSGGLIFGLSGGLSVGLIGGLIGTLSAGLNDGLSIGLIGGLVFGLISGFIEQRSHPEPAQANQHFRASTRLCVLASAAFGIFFGTVEWFLQMETFGLLATTGFWCGFWFLGGVNVINHVATRLALKWEGKLPFPLRVRRLIAFLDSMRDRLILTRVGGGWIFIHRELMNFLAKEPFGTSPSDVEEALKPKGNQP